MKDPIERQAAIDAVTEYGNGRAVYISVEEAVRRIEQLPFAQPYSLDEWCTDCKEYDQERHCCPRFNRVIRQTLSEQTEIVRCKDCKYFEFDHFEKVEGFPIPIIIAHEICMKWGEGCKSSVDGWCFKAERRTDEADYRKE